MAPISRASEVGLTLLELLVVISLLTLLAVGLPGLVARDLPQHKPTMRALADTLRQARAQAIRDDRPVVVVFDPANGLYGIARAEKRLAKGLRLTVTTAREAMEGARPAIRFFGDGSSTGGRVELTGDGKTGKIDVRWLTGSIRYAE